MKLIEYIPLLICFSFFSCQDKEQTLKQQYISIGRMIYLDKCSNCHQENGNGLGKLYPPLNKSDFLMNEPAKVACLIKYGLRGEITVNGTVYNQEMPNNIKITPVEIAQLITYMTHSWDNKKNRVFVSKERVKKELEAEGCAN